MSERIKYGYRDHLLGQDFNLYYGENYSMMLIPCQLVTDRYLAVGVLSNNNLNPARFLFDSKDRQPIVLTTQAGETYTMTKPGKSAMFHFGEVDKAKIGNTLGVIFERFIDRRDHLHIATVGRIMDAGWRVYWTPLPERGNLLHVRIVPNCYSENGRDPNMEEASKLRNAFEKAI